MTEQTDGIARLTDMVKDLALRQSIAKARALDIQEAQNKLETTEEWIELERLQKLDSDARTEYSAVDTELRTLALEIGIELRIKKPAPGVDITKGTVFEIVDEAAAMECCRQKFPTLIIESLDKTGLKKIVTALGNDHGVNGVSFRVEEFGKVKVATDLAKAIAQDRGENE